MLTLWSEPWEHLCPEKPSIDYHVKCIFLSKDWAMSLIHFRAETSVEHHAVIAVCCLPHSWTCSFSWVSQLSVILEPNLGGLIGGRVWVKFTSHSFSSEWNSEFHTEWKCVWISLNNSLENQWKVNLTHIIVEFTVFIYLSVKGVELGYGMDIGRIQIWWSMDLWVSDPQIPI